MTYKAFEVPQKERLDGIAMIILEADRQGLAITDADLDRIYFLAAGKGINYQFHNVCKRHGAFRKKVNRCPECGALTRKQARPAEQRHRKEYYERHKPQAIAPLVRN